MDSLFIVIVSDPGPDNKVITRIKDLPDQHELKENVWLVHSPMLVRELTNELGMGDDAIGTGVVFRLNGTYWGRADPDTWDWLKRGR